MSIDSAQKIISSTLNPYLSASLKPQAPVTSPRVFTGSGSESQAITAELKRSLGFGQQPAVAAPPPAPANTLASRMLSSGAGQQFVATIAAAHYQNVKAANADSASTRLAQAAFGSSSGRSHATTSAFVEPVGSGAQAEADV